LAVVILVVVSVYYTSNVKEGLPCFPTEGTVGTLETVVEG